MQLYELVYQSFANSEFSYSDLNDLMVLSKYKNNELAITGCLVYHQRTFIQVIEGERDKVKELFEKIKQDDRHSKIERVWESEIPSRGFSGWSMSLMNLEDIRFTELFSDYLKTDILDYDVKGIITTSKSLMHELKSGL